MPAPNVRQISCLSGVKPALVFPNSRVTQIWRCALSEMDEGAKRRSEKTLLFKACPMCKGDVELGSGMDGDYVKCLLCGFPRYMPETSRSTRAARAVEQLSGLPRASYLAGRTAQTNRLTCAVEPSASPRGNIVTRCYNPASRHTTAACACCANIRLLTDGHRLYAYIACPTEPAYSAASGQIAT